MTQGNKKRPGAGGQRDARELLVRSSGSLHPESVPRRRRSLRNPVWAETSGRSVNAASGVHADGPQRVRADSQRAASARRDVSASSPRNPWVVQVASLPLGERMRRPARPARACRRSRAQPRIWRDRLGIPTYTRSGRGALFRESGAEAGSAGPDRAFCRHSLLARLGRSSDLELES